MNAELARLVALADLGRHKEVDAWARPRAEAGDADGQFLLGYLVYAGAPVDFAAACEWFRKAAGQDHAEALYQLAQIDESRTDAHSTMPVSDIMRSRLRRAAELGSERAQHDLAVKLATGHGGFEKGPREARTWFERAARAGYLQSQVSFGKMCLAGEGGPVAIPEGLASLERVAATDLASNAWAPLMVSQASRYLLHAYERGAFGIENDPLKAEVARKQFEAARALLDRGRREDDRAVGRDADGNTVRRPFAFADRGEATRVLAAHMADCRKRSYEDLVNSRDKNLRARLRGPSGGEYEALVRVHWDDQPNGPITVGGSIEDVGWRTYSTISEFFTMAPDGTIEE
jgi:TPR repeat protein